MTRDEINRVIRTSVDIGFTHIKFTGGEPLLRSDIVDIISDTKKVRGLQEIQLVTNGTLLAQYAYPLKDAGLDIITLSIDAVEQEVYRDIRGGHFEPVLEGLHKCQDIGLPVRINTVLMRRNIDQVEPLMALASQTGASLKFLDLYDLQQGRESYDFWQREFYHFGELRNRLERMGGLFIGYEEAPGGIGAPLLEFRMPHGLQVVIKDATEGTFYADYCLTCNFYPCQDALISLRVTHDGHLKMCLIRNDNLLDILTPLRAGDINKMKKLIKDCFNILGSAKYYPRKWQPKLDVDETSKKSDAKDAHLMEYQVCIMDISQLDSNIWQSGGLFIGLSVAGVSLLIQTQVKNWGNFIVYMMLSAFGLLLLNIWQLLVNDWLRLININLIRMREIEHETGMERERLIQHDDEKNNLHYRSKADKLFEIKSKFPGKRIGGPPGVRNVLIRLIRVIACGWIVLLAKQLIYLLILVDP
jgi:cyclic pyranopterin phosphate synthase